LKIEAIIKKNAYASFAARKRAGSVLHPVNHLVVLDGGQNCWLAGEMGEVELFLVKQDYFTLYKVVVQVYFFEPG